MNLAFQPWIPIVTVSGASRNVSLLDCLTDSSIFDLNVRAHERVAMMRLLLCLGYTACGIPKTHEEWTDFPGNLAEKAPIYLEKWKDSFELFHETKPFLQVANIINAAKDEESRPSAAKLDLLKASGNNTTLFDHEGQNRERSITPERLAISLLTFQMFSPGGTFSKVVWDGKETPSKGIKDSPCIPVSMLHTFIRGKNLLESIQLNTIQHSALEVYHSLGKDWEGRPLWEQFPKNALDKEAVENATRTFLGRMIPLARVIQLNREGKKILLGEGLIYPAFTRPESPFPPEPSATIILKTKDKKQQPRPMSFQPDKAVWRELHALTVKRKPNAGGIGSCLALVNIPDGSAFDLVVVALGREQAKILDTLESVFHISALMFSKEGRTLYEKEVARAETIAEILKESIKRYRKSIDDAAEGASKKKDRNKTQEENIKRLQSKAILQYWTQTEKNLPSLMKLINSIGSDAAPEEQIAWSKFLQRTAFQAFDMVCSQEDIRHLRAYSVAKSYLAMNISSKIEKSSINEHKEDNE